MSGAREERLAVRVLVVIVLADAHRKVSVPHSRMVLEDNWEEYGEFYDFSLDDTFSDIEGAEDADEEVADDDAAAPSSDAGAIVPRDVSTSR